jgi:hypothetical protein
MSSSSKSSSLSHESTSDQLHEHRIREKKNFFFGRIKKKKIEITMRCETSKIVNPATKKCVSRSGRIGTRLLAARCRDDQVLNTKTSRCVKRSGRLGQASRKKIPSKKKSAPKSPFAERRAFTGPLAYAQTSFLLKQLKQRSFKTKKLHPPSSARLTKADLRRVRRGEAEFNVILPTRPFQISVLNKRTLNTYPNDYFEREEGPICAVAAASSPWRTAVYKTTFSFNKWLHELVSTF